MVEILNFVNSLRVFGSFLTHWLKFKPIKHGAFGGFMAH
jgi:hypothetical protein